MTNQTQKNQGIRKALGWIGKFVFVGAVLWFLSKKDLISMTAVKTAFSQWNWVLPGVVVLLINSFLAAYRWQILLSVQGLHVAPLRTLQLSYIGNFFNIALPGAVSGDLVKAYYVSHELQGSRAKAFGTILFDRIVGTSALVLVSVTALMIEFDRFIGTAVLSGVKAFVIAAGLAVVAFYSYLLLVKESHDPILKLLMQVESRVKKADSLVKIYLGVRDFHSHRLAIAKTLGLSFLIHLSSGYACICFARALGEILPSSGQYVVVPLGLLVTAVPVLPGGVGTGHAAFSFFYHLLESQRGADVFTFFVMTQLLIGLLGGLVYLQFKKKNAPIVIEEVTT